jgi:hypothetical protein
METGYWEESPGVKSNSRMTGSIVIYSALVLAAYVVVVGLQNGDSVLLVCTSAAALFSSLAGLAMLFIFKQKQTEKQS